MWLCKAIENGMCLFSCQLSFRVKNINFSNIKAELFEENRKHISISGVQEKFSVLLEKNKLRLIKEGERGRYILKPIPSAGKLAGRTPQTHGEHYKYLGNYLEVFQLMEANVPAYKIEAAKLFKILLFNYLFSNGDAHFKNFSLLETPMGDYRLSPAYDLLNSRIHISDNDFALNDGLLPRKLGQGKISKQFLILDEKAGIVEKV